MSRFEVTDFPAVVSAVEQVLGSAHPVTALAQACAVDDDMTREAWLAIEALPDNTRRAIAGILATSLFDS